MVLKYEEPKSWDRSSGEIVIYPQCNPCDHCKLPVMFHKTGLFSPKKVIKEQTQLKRTVTLNYPLRAHRLFLESAKCDRLLRDSYSPGVPFLVWLKRVCTAEEDQGMQFHYLAVWTGCIFSTSQASKREWRLAISGLRRLWYQHFFFFFQKTKFRDIGLKNCLSLCARRYESGS